jgi:hypothetical protein
MPPTGSPPKDLLDLPYSGKLGAGRLSRPGLGIYAVDSDGDRLFDFEEIQFFHTRANRPDSDGGREDGLRRDGGDVQSLGRGEVRGSSQVKRWLGCRILRSSKRFGVAPVGSPGLRAVILTLPGSESSVSVE